jgi:hypothetical protein
LYDIHIIIIFAYNLKTITMGRKFLSEKTTTNVTTGEILTEEKTYVVKTTTDKFFMSFISSISGFYELQSVIDTKLLVKICEYAEYNTGKAFLSTERRVDICKEFNCSNQSITNSIARLKQKNFITGSRYEFIINPEIFWTGELKERARLLKENKLRYVIEFQEAKESFES